MTTRAPGKRRVVVGISGASGSAYGIRLLEILHATPDVETHLVVSRSARQTMQLETSVSIEQVEALADVVHSSVDIGASISSGSFRVHAMVIAPCSIKTMSNLAWGNTGELLARAADVALKERRQLILVPREAPYSSIHLENMLKLSNLGVTILPASPGFYHQPQTLDDLVDFVVARILNCLNIPQDMLPRWGEHHLVSDD